MSQWILVIQYLRSDLLQVVQYVIDDGRFEVIETFKIEDFLSLVEGIGGPLCLDITGKLLFVHYVSSDNQVE